MASALREWLPNVLQSVDIWMSDSDIDIGSRWGPDLDKELEKSQFGILCITPESATSTWIHYEAGALSKFVDKSHVCQYLLGLQPTDIKGPLMNFQAARADKEDTLKFMQTINRATGERILPDARIATIFERFWPDLEAALARIPPEAKKTTEPSRSQDDMVEEILKTVREQARIMAEMQNRLANLEGFLPAKAAISDRSTGVTTENRIVNTTTYMSQDKNSEMVIFKMSEGPDYKITFEGQEPQDRIIQQVIDEFRRWLATASAAIGRMHRVHYDRWQIIMVLKVIYTLR